MKFYYGTKSISQIKEDTLRVCNALGGGLNVQHQMLETACTETRLGTYPDSHPEKLGVGLCQHDQIGLDDIQQEGEARHFKIVKEKFGYDIPSIVLKDLAYDPLLSLICCRLSYKRIPARIPAILIERAVYWKRYYNTESGKGTIEHYLESVEQILGIDWS
jgi:hypothetical protein